MAEPELQAAGPLEALGAGWRIGNCRLLAAQPGVIVSVSPFAGQAGSVSAVLKTRIGAGLPPVGHYADGEEGRVCWFQTGQYLVLGQNAELAGTMAAALAGRAAVVEQSDGWTMLALIGPGARGVMARLCPLDLIPAVFPQGSAARSLLGHLPVLVTAIPGGFGLMVMRSATGTTLYDIRQAMESLAAREG